MAASYLLRLRNAALVGGEKSGQAIFYVMLARVEKLSEAKIVLVGDF